MTFNLILTKYDAVFDSGRNSTAFTYGLL